MKLWSRIQAQRNGTVHAATVLDNSIRWKWYNLGIPPDINKPCNRGKKASIGWNRARICQRWQAANVFFFHLCNLGWGFVWLGHLVWREEDRGSVKENLQRYGPFFAWSSCHTLVEFAGWRRFWAQPLVPGTLQEMPGSRFVGRFFWPKKSVQALLGFCT